MTSEGFIKKAMKFLGIEEEEQHFGQDEVDEFEEEPVVKKIRTRKPSERVLRAIDGEGPSIRVFVAEPKVFNDVQVLANKYRIGIPVIVNLQGADDITARRVIDFVSGMVYALKGGITPIGNRIYIITPKNIEITPEDRRRLRETFFKELGIGDF
ncbi:MAG: cell division protein SepF [Actinobacteria bacterium]|nr:cell division protein SepF [Actinomycetota bacterium]